MCTKIVYKSDVQNCTNHYTKILQIITQKLYKSLHKKCTKKCVQKLCTNFFMLQIPDPPKNGVIAEIPSD